MEIVVGESAGFCYGVKRAVDGAMEEIQNSNGTVYCLGEIVHNKEVIKNLQNKGMVFIENILNAKGTTIIRAHGVPKEVYEIAQKNNIEIKDYTCPKVLKIHEIAQKYANSGYYIFLTGSKDHPENIGTISYCGDNYYVLENEEMINEAIEEFNKSGIKKLLVISQTTFSMEKFENIKNEIGNNLDNDIELVIKNTICLATKIRQEEVANMSKEKDKMIIIGGKNSSNTKKLYEIASKYCKNTICIENESELDSNFVNENDKIGIMAGASTPQESIDYVLAKLKKV